MNANEWLAAYADKLGTDPPTKDELKAVLDLAGEAAHRPSGSPRRSRAGSPRAPASAWRRQ